MYEMGSKVSRQYSISMVPNGSPSELHDVPSKHITNTIINHKGIHEAAKGGCENQAEGRRLFSSFKYCNAVM